MRAITIGLGVLVLAGCSVPIPEQENGVTEEHQKGPAFNVVNPASPNAPDPAATAQPGGLGGKFPAIFMGRWGLVPADCISSGGDAKGLMTVEADRLSFYESRASIAKIDAVSPTEVQVTLAFSGEGREWTQDTPMVLENNGTGLTRFADGQTLHYTRCGA